MSEPLSDRPVNFLCLMDPGGLGHFVSFAALYLFLFSPLPRSSSAGARLITSSSSVRRCRQFVRHRSRRILQIALSQLAVATRLGNNLRGVRPTNRRYLAGQPLLELDRNEASVGVKPSREGRLDVGNVPAAKRIGHLRANVEVIGRVVLFNARLDIELLPKKKKKGSIFYFSHISRPTAFFGAERIIL